MSTNLNSMVEANPTTVLWNDSANPNELKQSIAYGAVGATCNPVIAVACVKADLPRWTARIRELDAEMPEASESEIGAGTAGTGFFRVQLHHPDNDGSAPTLH